MNQKYNICFKGPAPELSADRLYLLLTKICKGNTDKVDEILDVPGTVLMTVKSPEEAAPIIQKLKSYGILCCVEEEVEEKDEDLVTTISTLQAVACPHCGTRQSIGRECIKCGNPLSSNSGYTQVQTKESEQQVDEVDAVNGRSWKIPVAAAALLIGVGYLVVGDEFKKMAEQTIASVSNTVGDPLASSKDDTAIMAMIKGLLRSDPSTIKTKPVAYDPMSGVNPYKERFESLGVDIEKITGNADLKVDGISLEKIEQQVRDRKSIDDVIKQYK